MNISQTGYRNVQGNAARMQSRGNGAFGNTAAGTNKAAEHVVPRIVNGEKSYLSAFGFLTENADKMSDKPSDVGTALKSLSQEQRNQLKGKYDIKNITMYSDEYNALINDLYDMGAISEYPFVVPDNLVAVSYDSNGNLSSMLCKEDMGVGDNQNMMEWLDDSISRFDAIYAALKGKDDLDDDEKLFMHLYGVRKDFYSAMQEIFAGDMLE